MRIVFAGTPEFAAIALQALARAGHDIALVLTQPDRPAGRGLKLHPSAVKRSAIAHGMPLLQPSTLKDEAVQRTIRDHQPDVMVVAAYGLMVPPQLLALPPRGCINIHASLLPRWRGAAPIQRAILAGDAETGISIMQMDEGLDTGPVLLREPVAIAADDTAQTLHDKLAALGGVCIVRALAAAPEPQPQDERLATYAAKIDKSEAQIAWDAPADVVVRKVHALNPVPGAATMLRGVPVKLWRADALPQITGAAASTPATVIAADGDGIVVACGVGALRIVELQRAGGRRLAAAAFLAGFPVEPGERFGC
ncbi:MAG TPA: methionyl-tRNA formyltransferase [Burkholderiales bacterium]|nr:methionyl-tRNA formyltransferase [Burkholderiales bacterium]